MNLEELKEDLRELVCTAENEDYEEKEKIINLFAKGIFKELKKEDGNN